MKQYVLWTNVKSISMLGFVTADFVRSWNGPRNGPRTVSGSLFLSALLNLVLGPKQAASFGPTLLNLILYRRTKASSLIWS